LKLLRRDFSVRYVATSTSLGAVAASLLLACAGERAVSPSLATLAPDAGVSTVGAGDADLPPSLAPQSFTVTGDPGKAPPPPPPCAGMLCDSTLVVGSLPGETVERVIHLNRARFRACYAAGVSRNAALAGRVIVEFTIRRSGEVGDAAVAAASTLPDGEVRACLLDAFRHLSFPQPEGGVVSVTYPMSFSPAPRPTPP
jgi:TonB family protein